MGDTKNRDDFGGRDCGEPASSGAFSGEFALGDLRDSARTNTPSREAEPADAREPASRRAPASGAASCCTPELSLASCCTPAPGATSCCAPPPGDASCCTPASGDSACCAGAAGGTALPQVPGYRPWSFVRDFVETAAGRVPRVRGQWSLSDRLGAVGVRLGLGRDGYRVAPGLYALGEPGPQSPVLVTANYKLTFDSLRRAVSGLDAWILVLETLGVNVWCAAGKKTFSTDELVRRITLTGLEKVVSHRVVVVPQLGAVGVSAREARRQSGFRVAFGPVRARDLPRFLAQGMRAGPDMRQVEFSAWDRLAVALVEFWLARKTMALTALALFLLAGLGADVFSFRRALAGLGHGFSAYLAGFAAGSVLTPLLLPWLPGRAFSLKGAVAGALVGLGAAFSGAGALEALGLWLGSVAVASWYAMNYTGSTTFTSPSGVEREMRLAMPWQAAGLVAAAIAWRVGLGA